MEAAVAERAWNARLPLAIAVAALLAAVAPLGALLIGPIVFGVPHVIGDMRALWLRKPGGFGGATAACVALALLAMTLLRIVLLTGAPIPIEAELACGIAAVACAAIGGARGRRSRLYWALGVAVLGGLALLAARETLLLLAHAHNLVALLLWLAWSPSRGSRRGVLLFYIVGAACVAAASNASVGREALGAFDGARLVRELAPGLENPLGDALVRSFAFAQLVHYGIWSWQLPGGSRTTLRQDFGLRGLWLCALVCIAVPICGWFAPVETRSTYLQIAIAHGWIELSVIAYLLARSGTLRGS
ncbi:MAG: hypothetical protein FJ294_05765 [Planctomycetes bacterium]|nr:hypothetical protein [Planctomycetota bacterium]